MEIESTTLGAESTRKEYIIFFFMKIHSEMAHHIQRSYKTIHSTNILINSRKIVHEFICVQ